MFVAKCAYCDRLVFYIVRNMFSIAIDLNVGYYAYREFVQKTSVPTVGQKEVGLDCPWVKAGGRTCRGKLHDNILDWEHNLPERDLEMADMHST